MDAATGFVAPDAVGEETAFALAGATGAVAPDAVGEDTALGLGPRIGVAVPAAVDGWLVAGSAAYP